MAKFCPHCRRPNNERAPRCLYCGLPFPLSAPPPPEPAEPEKTATETTSAPPPPPPEAYIVTVSPAQELSGQALNEFAKLLTLDPYSAKQKLKHPAPWMARIFPDLEPAQALLQQITRLGLDAYIVKQSGIDKISDRLRLKGLVRLDDDEIVFREETGRELKLEFEDVFLIVRGRVQERTRREEDEAGEGAVVHLGKKIPAIGESEEEKGRLREWLEKIPVRPRPNRLRWTLPLLPVEIMDIYRKKSAGAWRLAENEFDYAGLGQEMSPSSLINFMNILNRIKNHAPHCLLDSSFNSAGTTLAESPTEDKIRNNLIKELAVSLGQKKVYDNRTVFDDYSARLYLHYLRQTKKAEVPPKKEKPST